MLLWTKHGRTEVSHETFPWLSMSKPSFEAVTSRLQNWPQFPEMIKVTDWWYTGEDFNLQSPSTCSFLYGLVTSSWIATPLFRNPLHMHSFCTSGRDEVPLPTEDKEPPHHKGHLKPIFSVIDIGQNWNSSHKMGQTTRQNTRLIPLALNQPGHVTRRPGHLSTLTLGKVFRVQTILWECKFTPPPPIRLNMWLSTIS
jgi:hypothetical protein